MAGNHDIMASLAARLMGGNVASSAKAAEAPQKSMSPAAPRFFPATHSSMNGFPPTPSPTKMTHPPPAIKKENVAPAKPVAPEKTDFIAESEPVSGGNSNIGPSLLGSADQLAAARAFMDGATPGGERGGSRRRPGRERLLSKAPSVSSNSSSSISPRRPIASLAAGVTRPSSADTKLNQFATNLRSTFVSAGSVFDRPSEKPAQAAAPGVHSTATHMQATAPTPVNGWAAFTAKPEAERQQENVTRTVQKTVSSPASSTTVFTTKPAAEMRGAEPKKEAETATPSAKLTHAHPAAAARGSIDEAKALSVRQLANVTNTLKERAVDAVIPPHLRAKTAAAGIPEKKAVSSSISPNSANDASAGNEKPAHMNGTKATIFTPQPEVDHSVKEHTFNFTASVKPDLSASKISTTVGTPFLLPSVKMSAEPIIKTEPVQTPEKPITTNGAMDQTHAATVAAGGDDVVNALTSVKEELQKLSKRMTSIENDQFSTMKQLEAVAQAEERRKFLGTSSAKQPFGIDVKCANGTTHTVQVHEELKVYELVRRVRTKADLSPASSMNPRVVVGDHEVGHGMMLGEVGVTKDAAKQVIFNYDG